MNELLGVIVGEVLEQVRVSGFSGFWSEGGSPRDVAYVVLIRAFPASEMGLGWTPGEHLLDWLNRAFACAGEIIECAFV